MNKVQGLRKLLKEGIELWVRQSAMPGARKATEQDIWEQVRQLEKALEEDRGDWQTPQHLPDHVQFPTIPGTPVHLAAQLLRAPWMMAGHLWEWRKTPESDLLRITVHTPDGRRRLTAPTVPETFNATLRAHLFQLLPALQPPDETWFYDVRPDPGEISAWRCVFMARNADPSAISDPETPQLIAVAGETLPPSGTELHVLRGGQFGPRGYVSP